MTLSADRPRSTVPATPEAALRIARTVVGALAVGPLLFWAMSWFITEGGRRPIGVANPDFRPSLALVIWAVIGIAGFVGAMIFRGKALSAADEARRGGAGAVFARAGVVQSLLIVAMALIEGPALFAGVMFLLFGEGDLLLYAAPVFLVGAALLFPRPEWFGAEGSR